MARLADQKEQKEGLLHKEDIELEKLVKNGYHKRLREPGE
jgi:hypothetical protein